MSSAENHYTVVVNVKHPDDVKKSDPRNKDVSVGVFAASPEDAMNKVVARILDGNHAGQSLDDLPKAVRPRVRSVSKTVDPDAPEAPAAATAPPVEEKKDAGDPAPVTVPEERNEPEVSGDDKGEGAE